MRRRFAQVTGRNDVVAFEHQPHLVAGHLHRDALSDACAHEIPHSRPTEETHPAQSPHSSPGRRAATVPRSTVRSCLQAAFKDPARPPITSAAPDAGFSVRRAGNGSVHSARRPAFGAFQCSIPLRNQIHVRRATVLGVGGGRHRPSPHLTGRTSRSFREAIDIERRRRCWRGCPPWRCAS